MVEKKVFDNELDPEIEKVRDQIINKIGDKPLEEVNQIIKKLLNEQMDEVTRLGALAARVKIIRSKIDLLYERKVEINKPKAKKVSKVEAKVWPITYLPYSDKETILIKYIFKKKPITKLKKEPKILQLVCLIIKLSILIYLKMKLTD